MSGFDRRALLPSPGASSPRSRRRLPFERGLFRRREPRTTRARRAFVTLPAGSSSTRRRRRSAGRVRRRAERAREPVDRLRLPSLRHRAPARTPDRARRAVGTPTEPGPLRDADYEVVVGARPLRLWPPRCGSARGTIWSAIDEGGTSLARIIRHLPARGCAALEHRLFDGSGFRLPSRARRRRRLVLVSWTMNAFAFAGIRWGPVLPLVCVAVSFALRLTLSGTSDSVFLSPRGGTGSG